MGCHVIRIRTLCSLFWGFAGGSDDKESAYNTGDTGLIPGSGRSPREGNGNPLQYSFLDNTMDRGAWRATIYGVTRVHTAERLKSEREGVTFLSRETAGGRPPGKRAVLCLPGAAY